MSRGTARAVVRRHAQLEILCAPNVNLPGLSVEIMDSVGEVEPSPPLESCRGQRARQAAAAVTLLQSALDRSVPNISASKTVVCEATGACQRADEERDRRRTGALRRQGSADSIGRIAIHRRGPATIITAPANPPRCRRLPPLLVGRCRPRRKTRWWAGACWRPLRCGPTSRCRGGRRAGRVSASGAAVGAAPAAAP